MSLRGMWEYYWKNNKRTILKFIFKLQNNFKILEISKTTKKVKSNKQQPDFLIEFLKTKLKYFYCVSLSKKKKKKALKHFSTHKKV